MIAWSIEAAQASGSFQEIIVSTDDAEVADVARQWGASVPFMRPAELADDYAGTLPVVRHAIEWCIQARRVPDTVCCIYATAPFVTPADLGRGLATLVQTGSEYAFSVTSYGAPIQRALRITKAGRIEMFQPKYFHTRSQDLETTYHDAGQFYWGRTEAWLAGKPIFSQDAVPVVIPRHRVQDIDTLEDWERAEWMFKAQHPECLP